MSQQYTFGDNPAAARRLEKVAALFAPTTWAFVKRTVSRPPALALDVGCGPGHTTRLLAEATGAGQTVGLDRSRAFLDLASAPATPGVRFVEHDVTVVPFPSAPADVIFSRFVLSHLANPESLVRRWRTQLTPGGVLLLEEVETIDTHEAAFRGYLDTMAERMRAAGGHLELGPRLARVGDASEVVRLRPVNARVVEMFLLNLEAQGDDGPLRDRLLRVDDRAHSIEWHLRQVAIRA